MRTGAKVCFSVENAQGVPFASGGQTARVNPWMRIRGWDFCALCFALLDFHQALRSFWARDWLNCRLTTSPSWLDVRVPLWMVTYL